MSEQQGHTKGPWAASGEVREVKTLDGKSTFLFCADIVLGKDDPRGWRGYIASVQSCDHVGNGITREEAEANARLIAAAPDLDAAAGIAITALAFAMETYQRSGDELGFVQAEAAHRALIAAQDKARGREQGMKDVTPRFTAANSGRG